MTIRDDKCIPNHASPEGAQKLIERLKKFWAEKGHPNVDFKAVDAPYGSVMRLPRLDIRSDLVDGKPREAKQ